MKLLKFEISDMSRSHAVPDTFNGGGNPRPLPCGRGHRRTKCDQGHCPIYCANRKYIIDEVIGRVIELLMTPVTATQVVRLSVLCRV